MTYPSLLSDVAWLHFQTEVVAKTELRLAGTVDCYQIDGGRRVFIINTVRGSVFGWHFEIERARIADIDAIVDMFVKKAKDSTK